MVVLAVLLLGSCGFLDSLTGGGLAGDADHFNFTTVHGSTTYDVVEISVTNVGSDLKIGIALYDPDGNLIGSRTTNTGGADLTYSRDDLTSAGAYCVRFSGTWGITGWKVGVTGDADSQGPYTFTVKNLDANDEFAGNHSIDDAQAIEFNTSYDAVLASTLEADYFAFTPTSSSDLQLLVSDVGDDLEIGVALYASNGEFMEKWRASTGGANPSIPGFENATVGAQYYLRFSGTDWDGWEVGGYGDHATKGPYTFTLNEVD